MFNSLLLYRSLIFQSVYRELQIKYSNSLLGFFWLIAQPLSNILIYIFVFSEIMKNKFSDNFGYYSYSIYICIGVICWNLFSESIIKMQSIFLENSNIFKKINIPKFIFFINVNIVSIINFIIIFAIFSFFLIFIDKIYNIILLINFTFVLLVQITLANGIGFISSVLTVFYKDTLHFTHFILQIMFWATPIVYPFNILPDSISKILIYNPLFHIFDSYHDIFVYQKSPKINDLYYTIAIAIILNIIGLVLYKTCKADLLDEL